MFERINSLNTRLQNGNITTAFDDIEDILHLNPANIESVDEFILINLLTFLQSSNPEENLLSKKLLLKFCLHLACNNPAPEAKLSQIHLCAEACFNLIQDLYRKQRFNDVVEQDIPIYLEQCNKYAAPLETSDKSREIVLKSQCTFFLGSCYNYMKKYGSAEELISDSILRFKTHFRNEAYKYSVLGSLYHAKAYSQTFSGHYERARKDYQIEVEILMSADDISQSAKKDKLDFANKQLQALRTLFS